MNRKHYAFYHPIPNPSPKGEGSDSPLRFGEGFGGEVTVSSLVEGLSLPRASQGMRWSKARFLEITANENKLQ